MFLQLIGNVLLLPDVYLGAGLFTAFEITVGMDKSFSDLVVHWATTVLSLVAQV